MKILGRHLVVELSQCDCEQLDDLDFLERCLNEAVRCSGATKVKSVFHRYNPQGVSGVVVIAESHCSIHTWPEYGYAAVDFFTCGETVDPYKAFESLRSALKAGDVQVRELKRGIPSANDEIIRHKSTPANHPQAQPAS
ncbi:MAG: adenosylmethionine decarboxylase [candidate division Zixibacteria bacterium]|nr:adenosylmethionine decarboxylase [candidate division Zixibacteria bacterium]